MQYSFRKQCKFLQLDDCGRLNNNPSPTDSQLITFGNCDIMLYMEKELCICDK